jgi:hypothetical protein
MLGEPMPDRSKIFLSYSRTDLRVATALARDLNAAGIEVWMDKAISVGERWSTAIQKALEECYAMVLVLSPDSMASANVEDEFTYFLDAKKPIVPVMVRETKLHFQLHRLQWIDFTQGDRESAYHDLIRALYKVGVEFPAADENGEIQDPVIARLLNEIEGEKRTGTRRRVQAGVVAGLLTITALIVAAVLLFTSQGTESFTREPTLEFVMGRIDAPDAILYEAPSRDSRPIATDLPENSAIAIRQRTTDERFLFVEFGRDRGFILARDVLVDDVSRLAIYITPIPQPTTTATQFMTPTPTATPSPTPEVVSTEIAATSCIVSVAPDANPQPALLGPSPVLFAALDTVKPGESFVATAQANDFWLYIGIGWIDRNQAGVALNSEASCTALPVTDALGPNRIRPHIKDLPLATDLLARQPILTTGLAQDTLEIAQAWNNYGGLLANLSELLSVDEAQLVSIIVDEANNVGGTTGEDQMEIRFEADLFESFLTKNQQAEFDASFYLNPEDTTQHLFRAIKEDPFIEYHGNNGLEWQAFNVARQIDESAAIRALRFGTTGLLGDAFARIGYVTPQEMFQTYLENPERRVIGKLDYIKNNAPLLEALRNQDWQTYAALYDARVGAQAVADSQIYYATFLQIR